MEVYSLRNLSFRYPGAAENAVNDVSFNVSSGEFVLLCGVSGSGKSTLLRCLKTCLRPHGEHEGEVLFFGETLDGYSHAAQTQRIGFVLSSCDNQTITDTVLHELAFGMENLCISNGEMKKRIAEISSFLGLEGLLDCTIDSLSGGKRRILNLASVLIMQPDVIILDEPVSQLDPVGAEEFAQVIRKVNLEFGTTVIVCEHELDAFFSVADRILVMSEGRLISDASPEVTVKELPEKNPSLSELFPLPARVFIRAKTGCDRVPTDIPTARAQLSKLQPFEKFTPQLTEKPKQKPFVTAENLFFSYSRGSDDVLHGANIKAERGEIMSVVGGNGAGKTTLLHCLGGVKRPYNGKIRIDGADPSDRKSRIRAALMPQDTTALFVKDRLYDDLDEAIADNVSAADRKKLIDDCAGLCLLKELLDRHPYDLSDGERQRAALAKLLLTNPQLMLLDEPVKGLDRPSKRRIGELLRRIALGGMCIIIVTHDMDFAAGYSDSCTLIFGGECTHSLPVRDFFTGSTFYTTSARRMTRNIIEGCITENDVLSALGNSDGDDDSGRGTPVDLFCNIKPVSSKEKTHTARPFKAVAAGVLFLLFLACGALSAWLFGAGNTAPAIGGCGLTVLFAVISAIIAADNSFSEVTVTRVRRKRHIMVLSLVSVLVAVPLTIGAGIVIFDDTKYLFISLLIMAECMLPFFAVFEKRVIRTRELVIIAVMCAFCVMGRTVFYMLPEFKPVTAVVIISGATLGAQSGFLVGSVGMLASNMIFGQGPWTPWQMFAMGLIGFVSGIVFSNASSWKSRVTISLFGFFVSVVIYGGIMDPASILMSHLPFTPSSVLACYLAGLPLDLVHGISTALFLYFCSVPVIKKLERIKLKYGLIE